MTAFMKRKFHCVILYLGCFVILSGDREKLIVHQTRKKRLTAEETKI